MNASVLCWKAGSLADLASVVQAARRGPQAPSSNRPGAVRLGIAFRGPADLRTKLERAETMLASGAWKDDDGMYCRESIARPSIAFLYPGQGSQAVNMLGGLRSALPQFERELQRLDSMQSMLTDQPLVPMIYTKPGTEADARLRNTRNAQPALGLVETAARLSLESLGVRASFHAGHSYGELPALCGAGLLDERLLLKLSLERGRLLDLAGQSSLGAMAALGASYDEVKALCERVNKRLEITNINAARQIVVSGPVDSIALLEEAAASRAISARRLATSCAFHSSLMGPVAARWRQFLADALPTACSPKPNARAFSNVTGRPYGVADQLPDLLARQIVEPVQWEQTCLALSREGANIFIEVGPGRTLSDLMARNASQSTPLILVLDPFDRDPEWHLAALRAQLAAAGVDPHDEPALAAPSLPQDAVVAPSVNRLFDDNRRVMERYFDQQTKLVELALRSAPPSDCATLTQKALASNQEILSAFLTSQETVARCLLEGSGVELPLAAPLKTPLEHTSAADRRLDQSSKSENSALTIGELPARIAAALRAAISDTTGFPAESIDEHEAFNHLGLDSLTMAEIWMEVANRVPEVTVFADRVHEIRTIGDVASLCSGQTRPRDNEPSRAVQSNSHACAGSLHETSGSSWSVVRAQLVDAMSAATGVPASRILAASDFEREAGLDVFKLEDLLTTHVVSQPLFAQAGRALLNARNLGDLDRLLARFDAPVVEERDDASTVRRFVLREEPLALPDDAAACPPSVLIVADAASSEADCLCRALTSRGSSVTFLQATDDVVHHAVASDATQMLLLAQDGSAAATLFALAKSLWGRDRRRHRIAALTIVGSHAYGPEARGAVGVARSLRRELPHVAIRTVWLRSHVADADGDSLLGALFSAAVNGDLALSGRQLTRDELDGSGRRARSGPAASRLDRDSRVLILGGGDGISAEIGVGVVRSFGCEILAVGRTPFPESLPYPDVQDSPGAAELLKRAILDDYGVDGPRADSLHRRWKLVSRQRALWSTKTRILEAGGRFSYAVADVTDADACACAIRRFQSAGPLHGVVHGAGIVCDHLLAGKSLEEFHAVVDTKVIPARVLRALLAGEPLQFAFFLSSMTSYTGTAGQTDYGAANEILNAMAQDWNSRVSYPVKSLLWSVWTETGLASAGLKRQMAKLGLDGIRTADGVGLLIDELTHGQKAEDWVLFAPTSTLQYSLASVAPSTDARPIPTIAARQQTAAQTDTEPLGIGRA